MEEKITKDELDTLRSWLPDGANQLIADETGKSARSVEQILLNPKRFNKKVIAVAVRLMEQEKAEINSLRNRIQITA